MTTRIGAIVEKSLSDIKKVEVIKAVVRREGARAVDTASITLPAGTDVEINDKVSYIQDDASIRFLNAIWNFQGSYRDESGFHHDGSRSTIPSNDSYSSGGFYHLNVAPNDGKFRSNYGLYFNGTGQEVNVPDVTTNSAELDFTKQFDVCISFVNFASPAMSDHPNGANNTTQILFAKNDGTNGVEIGIKRIGSGTGRKWVVYAEIRQGGTTTTFQGSGDLHTGSDSTRKDYWIEYSESTNKVRTIRFYRDENDICRLSLDGLIDGSGSGECVQTVAAGGSRTTTDLLIGTNKLNRDGTTTNNYDFNGVIYQIRVYCGGYLQEDEFEDMFSAGAQQMTMKVSGIVWKRKDNLKNIEIEVKSHASTLLESQLNSDNISTWITSTNSNELATHNKNLFDSSQTTQNILQTILYHLNDDFVFYLGRSNASTLSGKYLAEGAFLTNVELLLLFARKSFLTFPTRTFIYEYGVEDKANMNSGYTFKDTEYQIYERGEDDIKIINDIEIIGDIQTAKDQDNLGSYPSSYPHTYANQFAYTPISVTLTKGSSSDPSGTTVSPSKYEYDPNNRSLTILSSAGFGGSDYLWVTYEYELVKGVSGSYGGGDRQLHDRREDSTSIDTYGRHSSRIYLPQLQKKGDYETFTQKIIAEYKDKKTRYRIKAPFLINCIRENLAVTLSSDTMKFPDKDGDTTTIETVKSIEWRYPECTTVIQVGDYYYDSFDLEKRTGDATSTLMVGTNRTRLKTSE